MSASPRQENSRSRTRRFTDIFSSSTPAALSRAGFHSGTLNRGATLDRSTSRTESTLAHTPSPNARLSTFHEVVEEAIERHGPSEMPDDDSHQHVPLNSAQIDGGKVWDEFNRYSQALQTDLQKFQDGVQGLGSSLDLAHSARKMRECLSIMTWLIGENSKKLFPLVVRYNDSPPMNSEYTPEQRPQRSWPPVSAAPVAASHHDHIELAPIYKELKTLADNIRQLRDALEHFPEFENFGKRSLRCFEGDLEYWSSCLQHYGDGIHSREVQIYVHDLSQEIGKRLKDASDCVKKYTACIPTVRLSQEHALSNLQTLATIATFFSAVTAATLQYSIGNPDPSLAIQIVNALWFSSLVFSIASALNSSIAFMWRSAIYSSPHTRLPAWLWLWMRQSPTVFLLLSVISFLAGLGCFAVSSQPHHIWIVVIICECICSFSVAALLIWLAADKWSFYRLQKQQRPSGFALNQLFGEKTGNVLPTHVEHTASWSVGCLYRGVQPLTSVTTHLKLSVPEPFSWKDALRPLYPSPAVPAEVTDTPERSGEKPAISLARQRWDKAIKQAILVAKATRREKGAKDLPESGYMARLQSSLLTISVVEEIRHDAGPETCSIQFHPADLVLAICGKRLTMCCELGPSKNDPLKLPHYVGLARQVIWTACGKYVVTRTHRAVHIWSLPGNPDRKMHVRYDTSSFILGIPEMIEGMPSRFISIEGISMNKLAIIDIYGEQQPQEHHDFGGLSIKAVDITPDGLHLLLAVEVSQSLEGLKPMTASPARKLIVFNLQTFQVEHEVPVWNDVQHVTISNSGHMAIATYKEGPPPQLWFLRVTLVGIRLSLERQFYSETKHPSFQSGYETTKHLPIQFSGKGHFMNNDRFVLCATAAGEIHIWRRDRAEQVHVLNQLANDNDKPIEVACNRRSGDFMFATRSQDGTVRIWKTQETTMRELHVVQHRLSNNVLGLHSTDDVLQESPVIESAPLPFESSV